MSPAATMQHGGRIIETWVEPCPHCGREVAVPESASKVRCGACSKTFRTQGAGPVPLDTPTRVSTPPAKTPSDPQDSLVGKRLGGWTLLRLIGHGGMGRVYEAREQGGKRRVALKVLSEKLASDGHFVRRFHREAKLLSSLTHPHIVDVIDRGEDDGNLWFAMAYVRGESLRRQIERGPLKPKDAARITYEIAGALSYAHDHKIIHRDLKPENVLLDEKGDVHLVDFGLSRLVDAAPGDASTRLTRTDVILGTYEYMAPEQRRGERQLDGRADVFALGVILYEMLTGTLPLGRFTPPSELSRAVPEALDEVINKALATHRKDRFASAAVFQDAVVQAMGKPRQKKRRKQKKAKTAVDVAPVLPQHELDEARSILRHVEILGALDRVGGIILLLGGLGLFSLSPLMRPAPWALSFGGIVFVIFGLYLMGLGKRIGRLESGARESQITVSVLMLFVPPFLMALGIYGLIVMTSDRARKAFRLGAKALRSPDSVVTMSTRVVDVAPGAHPKSASLLMRAFTFLAIIWSLYVGFMALDVLGVIPAQSPDATDYLDPLAHYRDLMVVAGASAVFSLLVLIRMFLVRKVRRGVGLAVTAAIFLFASAAFLNAAIHTAHSRASVLGFDAAIERSMPESPVRRSPPLLHWESSK